MNNQTSSNKNTASPFDHTKTVLGLTAMNQAQKLTQNVFFSRFVAGVGGVLVSAPSVKSAFSDNQEIVAVVNYLEFASTAILCGVILANQLKGINPFTRQITHNNNPTSTNTQINQQDSQSVSGITSPLDFEEAGTPPPRALNPEASSLARRIIREARN